MTKAMLKSLKTACIITTVTGLASLVASAADSTTTTTPGTAGYSSTTSSGNGTAAQSTSADHATKSFIKEALRDNQLEIDLASMAMNKGQNQQLKDFAKQLQEDHTQANKELQPIAAKYGVNEDVTKSREREVNKFEKEASGPEFDKKFATEMLKAHQKDIAKFERAAAKVQEPDVKQYAENMLPKLRSHLQHAATVAQAVGVDQSTISSAMTKASAVGGTTEKEESTTGVGTGTSGKTDQGAASRDLQSTTPKTQP